MINFTMTNKMSNVKYAGDRIVEIICSFAINVMNKFVTHFVIQHY